jgi:uncharacterized protein (DUF983 family)
MSAFIRPLTLFSPHLFGRLVHALRQTVTGFAGISKLSQRQAAQAEIRLRRTISGDMTENEISLKTAAARALMGRCPCCGKGKLMKSYLKQVENCSVCGESFGQIRADDAAPWLTIILVGHVFLPFAFMVNVDWMPLWAAMGMWATCFTCIALAILPRAKALFVAVLWQTRAPGYKPVELG